MTETILVVEDEEISRHSLGELLRDEGYRVYEAPDGTAAIQLFEQLNVDLVLTDLRMPGHDGLAVLKHVREVSPETPVILMTVQSSITGATEAIRLGAQDYMIKPLVIDDVLLKIRRAIDNRNFV